MQIVIPGGKMPAISQFILDFKIRLLGIGIRKLPLHKPERKLLQNGRAWVDAVMRKFGVCGAGENRSRGSYHTCGTKTSQVIGRICKCRDQWLVHVRER